MTRTRLAHIVPFIAVAAASAGCRGQNQDVAVASVQSALETSRSTGLGREAYDRADTASCLDPSQAAQEAADRPSAGLYPSSCVTKTSDGASLHAELADCTGAFGRVHLNGGLDAKFTAPKCDLLHAEIADSGDLTANDHALDYSASADITVDGALRDVDWAGHWSTVTQRGVEVELSTDLKVVIDTKTSCIDLGGAMRGHAGDWSVDGDIEGLKVCPDACPSSGKVAVSIDGPRRDRSLHIEFDGSSAAKVTDDASGEVYTVDMICNDD